VRGRRLAAVLLLSAALLPLGASTATAAGGAPPARETLLPRAGSRLIVQPAAVGLVAAPGAGAAAALRSARLTVRDGCGRTLRTGAAGLAGAGAAVPLPAQNAGPGTWEVTWSTADAAGRERHGRWTFEVVEGTPCGSAVAGSSAPAALAGSGHHGTGAALSGQAPADAPPLVAVLAAAVALLVLGNVLVRALRRRRSRDLAVVVAAHAGVLAVAGARSAPGVAFAVLAAVLVAGSVVALAVTAVPGLPQRALLTGLVAGAAAAGTAALWAYGSAAVLATPPADAFDAVPRQAVATALAAAVLCAGGWYGTHSRAVTG
jgi:hypothetical protein